MDSKETSLKHYKIHNCDLGAGQSWSISSDCSCKVPSMVARVASVAREVARVARLVARRRHQARATMATG